MDGTAADSESEQSDDDHSSSTYRAAGPTRDQVTCGSRTSRAEASSDRSTDASQRCSAGSGGRSAARWLLLAAAVALAVAGLAVAGAGGAAAQSSEDPTPDYSTDAQFSVSPPQLGLLPWGTDDPRVEAGGSFAIGATVQNTGSEAGTRYVVFVPPVECENFDQSRLPMIQRPVTLEPGESQDVAFRCDVPADASPTTTQPIVGAMNSEGNVDARRPAETYDWGSSTGFEIVEPLDEPNMDIVDVSVRGSPQVGSPVTVGVAVNNTGGPGEASLSLSVDGSQVTTASGELDRYERAVVPLTYVPDPGSWGDQSLTVSTGDDSSSGTLTIAPQPFELTPTSVPSSVAAGETVEVTVGVANAGNATDAHPLGLVIGDQTASSRSVALDGGQTTTVTLSGAVPVDASGSINVSVVGPTDLVGGPVPVSGEASGLQVSFERVRDPVMPAAETIEVRANVTNPGASTRSGSISFAVDSQTVDTADVSVAGGESTVVTLSGSVTPTAGGSVSLSVSTDGSEAARTVPVAQPLEGTIEGSDGTYEPQPAGSDGAYRDVTGDGEVTQTDVITLFQNQFSSVVTENEGHFDYTGKAGFTHGDIVALFEYVVASRL